MFVRLTVKKNKINRRFTPLKKTKELEMIMYID